MVPTEYYYILNIISTPHVLYYIRLITLIRRFKTNILICSQRTFVLIYRARQFRRNGPNLSK